MGLPQSILLIYAYSQYSGVMKLFLTSTNITPELQPYFTTLVGKAWAEIKFALIENAADPYPAEKKGFVDESRAVFASLGMQLARIDLRDYLTPEKNIGATLNKFDVIWLGGGNVFYLRWLLEASGFAAVITDLLKNGAVLAGGSAGAIVAGPKLDKFDLVDDSSKSPELLMAGLGLTDVTVLPHWGHEKYQSRLDQIKTYYDKVGCAIVTLTDQQALCVDGDKLRVCP